MSTMTAKLFSCLKDNSFNSMLQVRKELSVRPTHFNTVGLERKSIPVTAVVSHTLNSLKEEIAVDVMVKTGVRARRETHYIMKPITVVSPVVVRFA